MRMTMMMRMRMRMRMMMMMMMMMMMVLVLVMMMMMMMIPINTKHGANDEEKHHTHQLPAALLNMFFLQYNCRQIDYIAFRSFVGNNGMYVLDMYICIYTHIKCNSHFVSTKTTQHERSWSVSDHDRASSTRPQLTSGDIAWDFKGVQRLLVQSALKFSDFISSALPNITTNANTTYRDVEIENYLFILQMACSIHKRI